MKLLDKYLVTEASLNIDQWEKLVKRFAKKLKKDYGTEYGAGFYVRHSPDGKALRLNYYQDGGQLVSDGTAQVSFDFAPDLKMSDMEKAMRTLLKDPKVIKMKKSFDKMAQGQADYYSKRPMKNWPGI